MIRTLILEDGRVMAVEDGRDGQLVRVGRRGGQTEVMPLGLGPARGYGVAECGP